MTTIVHGAVASIARRDTRGVLHRAASAAAAAATAAAAWLLHRAEAICDAGQLGGDYEAEVGRWSGARI